jgi:hypothetical protein
MGLLMGGVHAAGVYKWVDEQGRVHYGDRAPGDSARELKIRPRGTTGPVPSETQRRERTRRLLDVFAEERRERKEQAERERQRRAQAVEYCARARDRLRNLERSSYVYELDRDGNRVVLSQARRDQALNEARAAIKRWCRG